MSSDLPQARWVLDGLPVADPPADPLRVLDAAADLDVAAAAVLFHERAVGTPGFPFGPAVRAAVNAALAPNPGGSAADLAARVRDAAGRDATRAAVAVEAGGATDIGPGGREANEDGFGVAGHVRADVYGSYCWGVAAVADGMGGAAAGDRASRLAVDATLERFGGPTPWVTDQPNATRWPKLARDWVADLTRAAAAAAAAAGAVGNFGSTLTAVAWAGRRAVLIHLGDSRAYRARGGRLELLTRDQSRAQELVDRGELSPAEFARSPLRSALVGFVGSNRTPPQVEVLDLSPGDRYLLASDGLVEGLDEADLTGLLSAGSPGRAAAELVRRAGAGLVARSERLDPGGSPAGDNLTAVVVAVPADS